MPLDDALAILMESIYRRTGTSVANLAAINAEVRALARGYAASRLREAAGKLRERHAPASDIDTYFADWLAERAAAEERG